MKQDVEEDIAIRRYLMGDLQPDEQLLVEERLFLDNEYFQMRQAIEDDLIDEYLYGEFSPDERERFEKHFLSTPERHEALKIAEALKHYISTNSLPEATPSTVVAQPPSSPPKVKSLAFLRGGAHSMWRLPLAASLIAITIFALWLVVRVRRPANRQNPIQAQQPLSKETEEASNPTRNSQQERNPQSNTDSLPAQGEYAEKREKPESEGERTQMSEGNNQARQPAPSGKETPAHVYSFALIPGGIARGGGGGEGDTTKLELRSGTGYANLQLLLLSGGDFHTYRAVLLTDNDKPIRNWAGLKSTTGDSGKFVSIKLPTRLLRRETYHVKLSGDSSGGEIREISTYYFDVVK
jgi:hypothetical protein